MIVPFVVGLGSLGTGVASPPSVPGVEFTLDDLVADYTIAEYKAHYTMDKDRAHYTMRDEK